MSIKKKSFNLLVISGLIILITVFFATFWETFKLGENKISLAISIIVAFGISITGLITGMSEYKLEKRMKLKIAIIGHVLILLFYIYSIIYSLYLY